MTTPTAAHFRLDDSVRRIGGGRVLVGGSPLRLFRLTDAGSAVIDAVESAVDIDQTPAVARLLDRFLDAGVLHPMPRLPDSGARSTGITVVIPAFCADAAVLRRLVEQCGAEGDPVIVVDDGSPEPVLPISGATVIRHDVNRGPAAARTTGVEVATTPLVAFVDTDVVLPPAWREFLLWHFQDERVALVAPRVASAPGTSVLDRYETLHSPLDLGPLPARVRSGTRVSYVPAATMVVRVDALRAVGGFDETMRVGEDVDLVWRLDEAGFGVRYEPQTTVHHRPRTSWWAWVRQRYGYGSSAASLARRHQGALAPVRVNGWSAAAWLLVLCGRPLGGASVAATTTGLLAHTLRGVPGGARAALRLAGLGHLYAGRSLASGLTRAWWPLAWLVALWSHRCRRIVLTAMIVPPAINWVRLRPPMNPLAYIAIRNLDDLAYGAGVFVGVVEERSLEAVRPDFSSWSRRRGPRRRR